MESKISIQSMVNRSETSKVLYERKRGDLEWSELPAPVTSCIQQIVVKIWRVFSKCHVVQINSIQRSLIKVFNEELILINYTLKVANMMEPNQFQKLVEKHEQHRDTNPS